MDPETVTIAVGDNRVSGLFLRPADARALYLFAHGAGAGMTHRTMESNAQGLAARGIGRPDPPRIAHAAVRGAASKARALAPDLPIFAGGRSFGGRMTSQAQSIEPIPHVRGLAFLGFPLHPAGNPGIERAEHLKQVRVPMLFVSGDRDALAETDLLKGVVARLGDRATLHLVSHADHTFKVAAKSGRTSAEAEGEALDTLARWMLERSD